MTGDMHIVAAIQESDDTENWPDAATFIVVGSLVATADGITSGDSFAAVTLTKTYWRGGTAVRNNNAGSPKIELARVATRFDVRSS